jgi:hypothetical protein
MRPGTRSHQPSRRIQSTRQQLLRCAVPAASLRKSSTVLPEVTLLALGTAVDVTRRSGRIKFLTSCASLAVSLFCLC